MSKIVIGICGKARQGKSTVSCHLAGKYNFSIIKISDIIREECSRLNDFCERVGKETVVLRGKDIKVKLPTILISSEKSQEHIDVLEPSVLQWWGEIRRKFYGSNYFVKSIFSSLEKFWIEGKSRICIDGIRYENECNFVKLFSFGYLFLVERYNQDGTHLISNDRNKRHKSEVELYENRDIKFDFTIQHQEGTTEKLLKKVDDILPDLLIK